MRTWHTVPKWHDEAMTVSLDTFVRVPTTTEDNGQHIQIKQQYQYRSYHPQHPQYKICFPTSPYSLHPFCYHAQTACSIEYNMLRASYSSSSTSNSRFALPSYPSPSSFAGYLPSIPSIHPFPVSYRPVGSCYPLFPTAHCSASPSAPVVHDSLNVINAKSSRNNNTQRHSFQFKNHWCFRMRLCTERKADNTDIHTMKREGRDKVRGEYREWTDHEPGWLSFFFRSSSFLSSFSRCCSILSASSCSFNSLCLFSSSSFSRFNFSTASFSILSRSFRSSSSFSFCSCSARSLSLRCRSSSANRAFSSSIRSRSIFSRCSFSRCFLSTSSRFSRSRFSFSFGVSPKNDKYKNH